jgi:uncharacterized protein YoxC
MKREIDLLKRQNEKLNNNYNSEHAERHCLTEDFDNLKWEFDKLLKKEDDMCEDIQGLKKTSK